jgi:hypothetical protein
MSAFSPFDSTSPIINRWSSHSKEDLLEHYGVLSDPLNDLLEESSQISPTDLSLNYACNKAIESLTHLFEKLTLEGAQEEKVETAKNAIFAKIQGSDLSKLSMYHLIERIDSQKARCFFPYFDLYIERKMNTIKDCQRAKGIIYKVTNGFNVTSYMLGMFHIVYEGTLPLNGRVRKILSGAEELILECELPQSYRIKEKFGGACDGLNHVLDLYLLSEARKEKKRISFLESREYAEEISRKDEEISARAKFSAQQEAFLKKYGDLAYYVGLDAFQNGDFEGVASYCKSTIRQEKFDYCCTERNRVWVYGDQRLCKENKEGLLKRLKDTQSPLVIAVGVAHMFFQEGLSKTLKREGLKVERDS